MEIIDKVKRMVIDGVLSQEEAEKYFPELAESEDEKIRIGLIEACKQSIIVGGFHKDKVIAWLEKQGEQKPVEWSKEDVKKLNIAIYSLLHPSDAYTKSEREQVVCWLKSFFPQPKQEWSKEDIDMIDYFILYCEKEYEELCNDKYGHQDIVSDLKRDCRKKLDWLESLKDKVVPQKHWKPSEEMLEALYRVIPENVFEKSEDEVLLDKLYQGLKYGKTL